MHFGFALDLSDIDLLNIDLLHQRYTHLDLFVPKTSSRHVFKTSSRNVFKTSSRHVFKTSSRGFEHQQMFAGNLVISFRQILSQERTVVEPEPVVQLSVPPIPSSLVAYELRPPALALWRRRGECYTYLGQLFSWSTTLLSSEKI